ncbi:hypothetical protein SELMODRAFT_411747 [Selaginella moellendorffii]|uniref:Uncharacterized protein n=1 Tax=Selaginella moellendorffii TaxID=88036 RepID=D8RIX2_SELML|nr:hypothetical protein SELMODRAFT_411747 [Selaginella moellendorffii]
MARNIIAAPPSPYGEHNTRKSMRPLPHHRRAHPPSPPEASAKPMRHRSATKATGQQPLPPSSTTTTWLPRRYGPPPPSAHDSVTWQPRPPLPPSPGWSSSSIAPPPPASSSPSSAAAAVAAFVTPPGLLAAGIIMFLLAVVAIVSSIWIVVKRRRNNGKVMVHFIGSSHLPRGASSSNGSQREYLVPLSVIEDSRLRDKLNSFVEEKLNSFVGEKEQLEAAAAAWRGEAAAWSTVTAKCQQEKSGWSSDLEASKATPTPTFGISHGGSNRWCTSSRPPAAANSGAVYCLDGVLTFAVSRCLPSHAEVRLLPPIPELSTYEDEPPKTDQVQQGASVEYPLIVHGPIPLEQVTSQGQGHEDPVPSVARPSVNQGEVVDPVSCPGIVFNPVATAAEKRAEMEKEIHKAIRESVSGSRRSATATGKSKVVLIEYD